MNDPNATPNLVQVHGRSMAPAIPAGSYVRLESVSLDSLHPGDVLALGATGGSTALHRLRGRLADGSLLTQGDFVAQADAPWPSTALRGRAVAVRRPGDPAHHWRALSRRWGAVLAWTMGLPSARLGRWLRLLIARWAVTRPQLATDAAGLSLPLSPQPNAFPVLAVSSQARFDVQRLGDEWVLHDRHTGDVHILNLTAGLVWDTLERGDDAASVLQRLRALYPDVSEETLRLDVETATKRLTSLRGHSQA